jgi:subfamily B ATP-binding cassette protein MsbA
MTQPTDRTPSTQPKQLPQKLKPNNFFTAVKLGFRSMLKHKGLALVFLLATLAQGLMQGLLVWSLREVLVAFSNVHDVGLDQAALAIALIFTILLVQSASFFCAEVASTRLAYRVEIDSMWRILSKLLTLSVRFFDKNSQSDLVMSSYHDVRGIRNATMSVGTLVLHVTRLIGLVSAAWLMSPKLAIIGLVIAPVGALPAYWLGQRITQAANRERNALTTLSDSFLQVSAGIRIIKVNRAENRVIERAYQIGNEIFRQVVRQALSRGLARFLLEIASSLGLIAVLIIGGSDVASGHLDWQSLLGLLVAILALYGPVLSLLQVYTAISSFIPNLDRVDRIMQAHPGIEDQPNPKPLKQAPLTIELKKVSFTYEDTPVLNSLSATFSRGETIGIVGPSGSGKSTLISLLLRLYDPTEGSILMDGVDLRDIRRADLMDNCAIVLQEPFLFIDTIANNISYARPNATIEEIIEAAKAANIHDEIMLMPKGYDTLLGRTEEGRGISVGQKQRICIAAALLKNAPILFLDEATSNLDSISEVKVQAAIERLMSGRTTFVIAHRLSTLRAVDRILVLANGIVAGLGPHAELVETCDIYRKLYNHQQDFAQFPTLISEPDYTKTVSGNGHASDPATLAAKAVSTPQPTAH